MAGALPYTENKFTDYFLSVRIVMFAPNILLGYFSVSLDMRMSHNKSQITQNQTQNQAE